MVSTRRIAGVSLRLSPKRRSLDFRLAKIIAERGVRFGSRIRLHQVSSVPATTVERRLLREHLANVRSSLPKGSRNSRKLSSLVAKARVLKASVLLGEHLGGRKPTSYQVLALPALKHGLASRQLLDSATAMSTIYKLRRSTMPWEGNPTRLNEALRTRLSSGMHVPQAIEDLLHRSTNQSLSSKEIARSLRLNWPAHASLINSSLQFLETSGFVRKMPPSVEGPASLSRWVHAAYENPPIDYPNVPADIMRRLEDGLVPHLDLFKEVAIRPNRGKPNVRGKTFLLGNPNAPFSESSVNLWLKKLVDAKVIEPVDFVEERGGGTALHYRYTKEGSRLWRDNKRVIELPAPWNKKVRRLSEPLRKLFLGEKD